MARKRKSDGAAEPDVIPPRKTSEMQVRVDATYLRSVAQRTRQAVRESVMDQVTRALIYAARGGQMEAFIALRPPHKSVDPHSAAEAVCEGLIPLGIAARPAQKEMADGYGFGGRAERGIECSWRIEIR